MPVRYMLCAFVIVRLGQFWRHTGSSAYEELVALFGKALHIAYPGNSFHILRNGLQFGPFSLRNCPVHPVVLHSVSFSIRFTSAFVIGNYRFHCRVKICTIMILIPGGLL